MEKEFPTRKNLRLKNYDYKGTGAYFVTICTQERKQLLSEYIISHSAPAIKSTDPIKTSDSSHSSDEEKPLYSTTAGEDLDPPENKQLGVPKTGENGSSKLLPYDVFRGNLCSGEYPELCLKKIGEIAAEQLLALEKRFPNVKIAEYVIMPDHIHVIIILRENTEVGKTSPSLFDVMRVFKSLTSRICKQMYHIDKVFQRSYMEHVIRDREDYEAKRKYIHDNPLRWYYKNLHTEK